jgi:hypothetical protein
VAKHYLFYEISGKTFPGGKTYLFCSFTKPDIELFDDFPVAKHYHFYKISGKTFISVATASWWQNICGKTFCFIF